MNTTPTPRNRQPRGTPTGGQYASGPRTEPELTLNTNTSNNLVTQSVVEGPPQSASTPDLTPQTAQATQPCRHCGRTHHLLEQLNPENNNTCNQPAPN